MSQENVEVSVKQFESTNARDFAGVMDTCADDVTLVVHWLAGQGRDTATGKAAVGEWFGDWFRQFGRNYRFDIEETVTVCSSSCPPRARATQRSGGRAARGARLHAV